MRRVMIIGGAGSGKSTLARRLGKRLDLPVVHIDTLFWEPGWVMAEDRTFQDRLAKAVEGDTWIMDGNYSGSWAGRLARADTVIFLDIPTWRRFWRTVLRTFRSYGRSRKDLGRDCPERFSLHFHLGWVLQYRRRGRLKALDLMREEGPAGHLARHHLKGTASIERFLAGLRRNSCG